VGKDASADYRDTLCHIVSSQFLRIKIWDDGRILNGMWILRSILLALHSERVCLILEEEAAFDAEVATGLEKELKVLQ
jgi:hypothetical protein